MCSDPGSMAKCAVMTKALEAKPDLQSLVPTEKFFLRIPQVKIFWPILLFSCMCVDVPVQYNGQSKGHWCQCQGMGWFTASLIDNNITITILSCNMRMMVNMNTSVCFLLPLASTKWTMKAWGKKIDILVFMNIQCC